MAWQKRMHGDRLQVSYSDACKLAEIFTTSSSWQWRIRDNLLTQSSLTMRQQQQPICFPLDLQREHWELYRDSCEGTNINNVKRNPTKTQIKANNWESAWKVIMKWLWDVWSSIDRKGKKSLEKLLKIKLANILVIYCTHQTFLSIWLTRWL